MAVVYPEDCNEPSERLEWLYRAQELLRYLHNLFAHWYRHEITLAQYDNPPFPDVDEQGRTLLRVTFEKLKSKYPYKSQLTQEDWGKFVREDFQPRSDKICDQIGVQKAMLKISSTWLVEVEDI
jgi:hypothetical protein